MFDVLLNSQAPRRVLNPLEYVSTTGLQMQTQKHISYNRRAVLDQEQPEQIHTSKKVTHFILKRRHKTLLETSRGHKIFMDRGRGEAPLAMAELDMDDYHSSREM